MAFARFRFPHFVYFSRLKNACTLVPTVFRWHGKMAFKCHLHFSFSHDIEKQIWILLFVFRFRLTLKNGFELRISFSHLFEKRIWISVFVFRFRITLKNGFEFRFSFLHCLLLKNRLEFRLSFLHEFEKWINTPVIWNSPHSLPKGMTGIMRGLSLHNHSIFIPR